MKSIYLKENFKALCKYTQEIARLYFKALSNYKGEVVRVDLVMENNAKSTKHYENEINHIYLIKVEKAFQKLDVDSQKIINNDFFYNNYKYWWIELYSTSTYYRLKRQALAQFLQYIYT